MNRLTTKLRMKASGVSQPRRGVIIVLTSFLLTVLFAFLAFSVDSGRIVLTRTEMQNAVDAASLAASQEIAQAVYEAGQGNGSANVGDGSSAVAAARQMAADVAEANGVFVDPNADVYFGRRTFNASSGEWPITWGATPYNTVKVVARRTGDDSSAPDGEFPLAFGWAVGMSSVPIKTSSTAFVEARDMVLVLDYSGSMNYDSQLTSSLGLSQAEELLDNMWDTMVAADPKWPGTSISKFPSSGFGNLNSYAGTYISSTNDATILSTLGLTQNNADGSRKYPYPQSGRYTSGSTKGLPKDKPSNSTSDSLWTKYVDFVKNHPKTEYRNKYGYRTLMDWLQQKSTSGFTPRDRYTSEDMWRTPHQPLNAIKNGSSLFLDFLNDLDFGDEVGLVGYSGSAWQVNSFNDGDIDVDLSSNPITSDYSSLDSILRHQQAGEGDGQTNIGDGIKKGREMLVGTGGTDTGNVRFGARPIMILMTDGNTNVTPPSYSMPSGFTWSAYTDYDGNGTADYTTTDSKKKYAIEQAIEAANRGIQIHTMAVGADADVDLLKAIAFIGGGVFMNVPGGSTVADMQDQLLDAFGQIASKLPPPKLVYNEE
jgi:Flp pilus assembly protein TadG